MAGQRLVQKRLQTARQCQIVPPSFLKQLPQAEHRRLVNRGVRDLIDRALSSTFEELGDEAVEEVMEHIAGYEKRLGF